MTWTNAAKLLIAASTATLTGCPRSTEAISPCQITPPTTLAAEDATKVKANLEGAYLAIASAGAGAEVEARSKVEATFATVSDDKKTCELVLRLNACAIEHDRQDIGAKLVDLAGSKCADAHP